LADTGLSRPAAFDCGFNPKLSSVRQVAPLDFVRYCPILHDSRPKPHDSLTFFHDSLAKTRDFRPKPSDSSDVIFDICVAT
jgi:hypothetical protein